LRKLRLSQRRKVWVNIVARMVGSIEMPQMRRSPQKGAQAGQKQIQKSSFLLVESRIRASNALQEAPYESP